MNKKEIRETAENIVAGKERHYWDGRQAEAEERESNGISKRQNKLLKDSDEWERNVKREYGKLLDAKRKLKPVKKEVKEVIETKRFNHMGFPPKNIPLDQITKEMEEKEEEWGIEFGEYLHDKR